MHCTAPNGGHPHLDAAARGPGAELLEGVAHGGAARGPVDAVRVGAPGVERGGPGGGGGASAGRHTGIVGAPAAPATVRTAPRSLPRMDEVELRARRVRRHRRARRAAPVGRRPRRPDAPGLRVRPAPRPLHRRARAGRADPGHPRRGRRAHAAPLGAPHAAAGRPRSSSSRMPGSPRRCAASCRCPAGTASGCAPVDGLAGVAALRDDSADVVVARRLRGGAGAGRARDGGVVRRGRARARAGRAAARQRRRRAGAAVCRSRGGGCPRRDRAGGVRRAARGAQGQAVRQPRARGLPRALDLWTLRRATASAPLPTGVLAGDDLDRRTAGARPFSSAAGDVAASPPPPERGAWRRR